MNTLYKKSDSDLVNLLANARATVDKLENTTIKMHDIINDSPEKTRQVPNADREKRWVYDSFAIRLIAFMLVWVVVLFSFIAISFFYFTTDMHKDVEKLIARVEVIQQTVEKQPSKEATALVQTPP